MNLTALPGIGPFLDPLALAIVLGGTVVAVVLRTPLGDLGRGLSALRTLARRRFDVAPLLVQIAAFGRIAQRHGVIALDRSVIADPDIAAAVADIVDGASPDGIAALLEQRRIARFERHRAAAEMWSAAADIAPAMGMIGTLIGLVQMFTAMADPKTIGAAMAVALLTTLYGAIVACLIATPVASRLRRHARHEFQERARLAAPLAALAMIQPRHGARERAA
ncbi:chemotaxis protein MotA [Sphingomonas naasensis]|uniref:Biopolymer transporter ExbB n=1 Tax=Sphingomonas naasensis TaxID=1344951 RepID=A0A4S1W8T8_9SPHN|nr:MotA/TolQ/ExbB proton channel family protein [Sphingomonas naasensis]NIJ21186.1 chemotaxis protein MotA [Sphingomonas naasensis]TGX38235.1 biopolymer transporter ExbB [Sphingomonas naasensis]